LGESIHTRKENTEALVVAGKEIGLQVNAEKTEYMVISCEENAGKYHSINIGIKSFECLGQLQIFGNNPNK
jgi:hypothetical protein